MVCPDDDELEPVSLAFWGSSSLVLRRASATNSNRFDSLSERTMLKIVKRCISDRDSPVALRKKSLPAKQKNVSWLEDNICSGRKEFTYKQ